MQTVDEDTIILIPNKVAIGRVSDHDLKNILLIGVDPPVETCLLSLFATTSYHALIDATYFAAFMHYRPVLNR